jgi:hypothetical protein
MRRALAIAAVAASLAAPVHANPRDIGLTSAARNEVIVVSGTERRGLKIGDRVFQEQQIRTGADSAAQLLFLDETALTVGPNSQLVLDKAVFDPDKRVGELSVRAVTGAFRFISGSSPSGSYTIKTPSGTIGVRGTWFVFLIQNDIIHIMVRHGLVRFCNIAGQCLNVLAGYQIRANDKYISAPTKASHETLDSVVQLWFASTTPGDLANLAPGAGPLERRFQRKAAIKFTHVLLGLYRYADRKDLSHYDAKFAFFVLLPKVIRLNREIKQIDNKQEFKEFKRDLREFRRESKRLIRCVDKKRNNFRCLHHDH